MRYENIKVLEINPVVYLGKEYEDNQGWKNQDIFKEKIKDLNFDVEFWTECPVDDLIYIYIDYQDDFEPLIKMDTIDKIFSVTNELLKVFKDDVSIELYLDGCMKNGFNGVQLTIGEFIKWLSEETEKYEEIN